MVLVPLVSLIAVRDTAPTDVRLRAAVDGGETADASRVARYAQPLRSSRSDAEQRALQRAVEEATTTTTVAPAAAPSTTTSTTATTAAPARVAVVKATTSTTKPPAPTTTAPRVTTTSTTAKPTTTTSTTAAPAPTTSAPAASACCSQEGGASYHDYPDPRTCAHRSLAKGTVLRVTNLESGRRTTCTVNDRGPYVEGRILDLSREAFGEIASVSDGVIRVRIEW